MNSPILWWTARHTRSVWFTRLKTSLSSRLANAAMAAAMAAALAVPAYAQNPPDQHSSIAKASPPDIKVDSSALQRSTGAITSFAPIVDKVGPSIVTISTTRNVASGNPMLRRFFGIPDNQGEEGGNGKVTSLGSGVIVSADGLILTNNHVAESGDEIMVHIGEHGHEYKATKVGNDPSSDLALLRIDAKNLPVLTFADSDQVKVGDLVLAVGSPFGLTNTVTMESSAPLAAAGWELQTMKTSSRPTLRSIPATPAARWLIPRAG